MFKDMHHLSVLGHAHLGGALMRALRPWMAPLGEAPPRPAPDAPSSLAPEGALALAADDEEEHHHHRDLLRRLLSNQSHSISFLTPSLPSPAIQAAQTCARPPPRP